MVKLTEGYMPFGKFNTYWRAVGERTEKAPLLTVHGGPGAAHNYLKSLDDLAKGGRQVIYYDQCGCGKSKTQPDNGRWSFELFLKELEALREYLNLERFHLLGQSWGGMLAIRFAAGGPRGLCGLVLASTPASVIQWNAETCRLLSEMPDEVRLPLELASALEAWNTSGYREALVQFYRRHICRMSTIPKFVWESASQMGTAYHAVKGENELMLGGILKGVDLTPLLPDIHVPTLVTAGKFDQCTPAVTRTLLAGIAGSRSRVFENSGHLAHVEEREAFNETVEAFLSETERRR